MTQPSPRLQKLQQQQEALKAKIRREEQKLKTAQRKDDTRRKILIGALVLKATETDPQLKTRLDQLLRSLKRNDERALFNLPPLPETQTDTATTATATEKENQEQSKIKKSFMGFIKDQNP